MKGRRFSHIDIDLMSVVGYRKIQVGENQKTNTFEKNKINKNKQNQRDGHSCLVNQCLYCYIQLVGLSFNSRCSLIMMCICASRSIAWMWLEVHFCFTFVGGVKYISQLALISSMSKFSLTLLNVHFLCLHSRQASHNCHCHYCLIIYM